MLPKQGQNFLNVSYRGKEKPQAVLLSNWLVRWRRKFGKEEEQVHRKGS